MNGPFIVAQANTASTAQDAQNKPVKVVKVTKPSDGQAITVELGHDQQIKVDLTAIAGENFTLAHIGETLIILFDNRSKVTIESYFDSTNVASPNVTFEVSPGRVVDGTELVTLFSFTTDHSVLPDAGKPGAPPAPASGADFSNASVEPLDTPDPQEASGPLPLLSPEFQPNGKTNFAEPTWLVDAALNRGGVGSDTGAIDTKNPTVTVDIVDGALWARRCRSAATAAAWLSPLRSAKRRAPASPNRTSRFRPASGWSVAR